MADAGLFVTRNRDRFAPRHTWDALRRDARRSHRRASLRRRCHRTRSRCRRRWRRRRTAYLRTWPSCGSPIRAARSPCSRAPFTTTRRTRCASSASPEPTARRRRPTWSAAILRCGRHTMRRRRNGRRRVSLAYVAIGEHDAVAARAAWAARTDARRGRDGRGDGGELARARARSRRRRSLPPSRR